MPEMRCSHGHHDGPCGHLYTRTFKDDIGLLGFTPTGTERTILEGMCICEGDHE